MIKTSTLLKYFIIAIVLLTGTISKAGIVRAIQTGNWESTSSWIHGILPANGDSIIIPAGKSIKVTTVNDYSGGAAMQLNIFGELTFQTGKKLTLPLGSTITIQVAAMITPGGGGGNSNTITVGNTLVWNTGMGTLNGFLILPWSPLPVEMIDFNAKCTSDETILISWETAGEVNNDYFDVERSPDGVQFETIGRVDGHGTSSAGFKYAFTDAFPKQEANYYRLKQVDFDNNFNYTAILFCRLKTAIKDQILLFPNPTKGDVFLSIPTDEDNVLAEVMISDTKANIVLRKQLRTIQGSDYIRVTDLETLLKPGIYFVTVTINEIPMRKQLVVY